MRTVLTLLAFFSLVIPATVGLAAEDKTVRVEISKSAVEPVEIKVAPGTTVAWVNEAASKLKIKFTANAVSTTCQGPLRFVVGPRGIFESETLAADNVASLCFLEKKQYPFVVEFQPSEDEEQQTASLSGTVVVE